MEESRTTIEERDMTPPAAEPERQQYFMERARLQVKELEDHLGRPLTCCINTFGCQMNARDSEKLLGILETIVRMARLTQLRVIAEGVEKKEHVDFLRNVGCIYGQGYYYYRPMQAEAFEHLLGPQQQ